MESPCAGLGFVQTEWGDFNPTVKVDPKTYSPHSGSTDRGKGERGRVRKEDGERSFKRVSEGEPWGEKGRRTGGESSARCSVGCK